MDLSVEISPACEQLDRKVPHPAMRADDDAEQVILAYIVALEVANATIGASGECKAELRKRYAAARAVGGKAAAKE